MTRMVDDMCIYEKANGKAPCCTHDCNGCVWWQECEDEKLYREEHGGYSEEEIIYQAQCEMQQYCERYEPTYNPEDGSM
jgi:hypothetical protein